MGGDMISFKDVTQIEHIRRQIEVLQRDLTDAVCCEFFLRPDNATNKTPCIELRDLLRDTMKRYTVAKIMGLLDEAARLGVDTAEQRELLVEYLNPEEHSP